MTLPHNDNDNGASERAATRAKLAERAKEQQRAMRRIRTRIMKRQDIGKDWDGKADNDNIAWPLATSLVREGNTELLKAAMAYRKTHDTAKSEAVLGGKSVVMREGFALDRHIHVRDNGTISYKHVRQRTAAEVDIPAKHYVPPFEDESTEMQRNSVKVPKPWDGDRPVNDMIDAQARLDAFRARLGALVEPLELAVIDGATYQRVGNSIGVADRSGSIAAGRGVVHLALIAIRDCIGNVRRKDLAA